MASGAPKSLSRLSRTSLLRLALRWLDNPTLPKPYLASNRDPEESEEEDYLYTPAEDMEALRKIYEALKREPETTKRDIIERIVEGDWRRGLSLHQLAMIDMQHLEESDTALRWSALRLVPLGDEDESDGPPAKKRRKLDDGEAGMFPRIQPATFLQSLKHEISPLVKAHYYLHRLPPPHNLSIIRIYITDHLFTHAKASTQSHSPDGSRALYIALPDSCPYVYVAVSGSSGGTTANNKKKLTVPKPDIASMKRTILEAIPKALSRPHERWALETTNLAARSLRTICTMRGYGRAEQSGGAYSIFTEAVVDNSPLDAQLPSAIIALAPSPASSETTGKRRVEEERQQQTEPAQVTARFGPGVRNAALDRLHVRIENVVSAAATSRSRSRRAALEEEKAPAAVSLAFSGTDVVAGLRKLAALGPGLYVDLGKMPGWMTGEAGVSNLTV